MDKNSLEEEIYLDRPQQQHQLKWEVEVFLANQNQLVDYLEPNHSLQIAEDSLEINKQLLLQEVYLEIHSHKRLEACFHRNPQILLLEECFLQAHLLMEVCLEEHRPNKLKVVDFLAIQPSHREVFLVKIQLELLEDYFLEHQILKLREEVSLVKSLQDQQEVSFHHQHQLSIKNQQVVACLEVR